MVVHRFQIFQEIASQIISFTFLLHLALNISLSCKKCSIPEEDSLKSCSLMFSQLAKSTPLNPFIPLFNFKLSHFLFFTLLPNPHRRESPLLHCTVRGTPSQFGCDLLLRVSFNFLHKS